MAKLVFVDDKDVAHEVSLSTVKTEKLKKTDVVFASYEVGVASTSEAGFALGKLQDLLKGIFVDNKVVVVATRNGKKDVEIKIITEE